MADKHHADLPEILGREAGQHLFVNLVCAKRRLVLLEPETTEPCRNVHARLPDAFNAALLPYPKLSLGTNTWRALSRPKVTRRIIAAIGVIIGSYDARAFEPGRRLDRRAPS